MTILTKTKFTVYCNANQPPHIHINESEIKGRDILPRIWLFMTRNVQTHHVHCFESTSINILGFHVTSLPTSSHNLPDLSTSHHLQLHRCIYLNNGWASSCPVLLCFLRENEHSELEQKFELRQPNDWLRKSFYFLHLPFTTSNLLPFYYLQHQGMDSFTLILSYQQRHIPLNCVSNQGNSVSSFYCSTDVASHDLSVNASVE